MTDYTELVEGLRALHRLRFRGSEKPSIYTDAADAIEELTAERDRLREAIDAAERAFDRVNEPEPWWGPCDEARATGAAIVRNAAHTVLRGDS